MLTCRLVHSGTICNLIDGTKEWFVEYFSEHPFLLQVLIQMLRTIGFLLGLSGGYSTIVNPAEIFGKYENAYHIAGVILLFSSAVALTAILTITILLLLTYLKV